jgi:hypothetical protein
MGIIARIKHSKVAGVLGRARRGLGIIFSEPRNPRSSKNRRKNREDRRQFQSPADSEIMLIQDGKIDETKTFPAWSRNQLSATKETPHTSSATRFGGERRKEERRKQKSSFGRVWRGMKTIFTEQRTPTPRRKGERRTAQTRKADAIVISKSSPSARFPGVIRHKGSKTKRPSVSTNSRARAEVEPNRRQKTRRKSD